MSNGHISNDEWRNACPPAVEKQRAAGRSEEAIASRSAAVRGMFHDHYQGEDDEIVEGIEAPEWPQKQKTSVKAHR